MADFMICKGIKLAGFWSATLLGGMPAWADAPGDTTVAATSTATTDAARLTASTAPAATMYSRSPALADKSIWVSGTALFVGEPARTAGWAGATPMRAAPEEAASAPAEPERATRKPWLSEVRVGVLAQDNGPIVNSVENGAAINLEALFHAPAALNRIGSPRPHVGLSAATDPRSTSYVYGGLTWERDYSNDWFLTGGFGLAVHDGEYLRKSDQPVEERKVTKTLGCRVDFHWGIGAGRRLSEKWNVALHYEHVSSGDVCIKGALGLENVGVRVGRVI
jgi:lipid A 3-O-deacylase